MVSLKQRKILLNQTKMAANVEAGVSGGKMQEGVGGDPPRDGGEQVDSSSVPQNEIGDAMEVDGTMRGAGNGLPPVDARDSKEGNNPVTWTRQTRNVVDNVDGGNRVTRDGDGDDADADADGEDIEGEDKEGAIAAGAGGEGNGEVKDEPGPEARRRSGRTIRPPKRQLETIAPAQNQRRTRQKTANSGAPVIKLDAAVGDGTVERTVVSPTVGQEQADLTEQAQATSSREAATTAPPPRKKKQAMRNSGRVDRRTGAYVQYPNPKAIKGQPMDQVQPMSRSQPQPVSQGEGGSSNANAHLDQSGSTPANQAATGMISFQASPYGEGVLPTLDNTSQPHPASASQPYFPHPGGQAGPDPHLYPHLAASSSSTGPHPHSPTTSIPIPHPASSIPTRPNNIRRPPTPPSPSRITPIDPSIPDPPYELIPYESCVTLRKWGINPRDLMVPERGRGCPFSGMGVVGGGGGGGGGINVDDEEDEKGKGKGNRKGIKGSKFSPSITSPIAATSSASASIPAPGYSTSTSPTSGGPPILVQLCKNRIDWNRSAWERHVFSHLPEKLKPYWQCPVCMRTFARKDSFKRHFGPGMSGAGAAGGGDADPGVSSDPSKSMTLGSASVGGGGGTNGGKAKGKGKKGAKGKAWGAGAGQGEEGTGGPEVKCWEEGNLGSIPENEWPRRWLVEPVVVRFPETTLKYKRPEQPGTEGLLYQAEERLKAQAIPGGFFHALVGHGQDDANGNANANAFFPEGVVGVPGGGGGEGKEIRPESRGDGGNGEMQQTEDGDDHQDMQTPSGEEREQQLDPGQSQVQDPEEELRETGQEEPMEMVQHAQAQAQAQLHAAQHMPYGRPLQPPHVQPQPQHQHQHQMPNPYQNPHLQHAHLGLTGTHPHAHPHPHPHPQAFHPLYAALHPSLGGMPPSPLPPGPPQNGNGMPIPPGMGHHPHPGMHSSHPGGQQQQQHHHHHHPHPQNGPLGVPSGPSGAPPPGMNHLPPDTFEHMAQDPMAQFNYGVISRS